MAITLLHRPLLKLLLILYKAHLVVLPLFLLLPLRRLHLQCRQLAILRRITSQLLNQQTQI